MTAILLILLSLGFDGLSLADLPGYRAALEKIDDSSATDVGFHDLWDRPEAYRSRPVRIEGRLRKSFRAPASGELPPRSEWWLATDSDDLICVVFPDSEPTTFPRDARVRMAGTSLGLIRYPSGDVTRMAPLVVGASRPTLLKGSIAPKSDPRTLDWLAAACLAAIVAVVIARMHARGRPIPPVEPPSRVEFES